MKRYYLLFLFSVLLITQWACTKKSDNTVIVYTTVDQIFSDPVLKDFEKESGIKVKALFDTEETKSTGILNRLIAEKDNPQCDVFWSGDPMRAIVLKDKGITASYKSPAAADIADNFKDNEGHWIGFSARARVLIYNTDLLKKEDIPESVFDLTKEKYKGQTAVANPLFGTTSFHFASWFSAFGDQKAEAFLQALKNNGVIIAASNGDVEKRVSQGEVWCGLTDTDDAFTAKNEGKPVDYVFLDQRQDECGNLIIPNTVSLIRGSSHPENAKKLIDYLLSRKTEEKLAVSCAQMPLHKGVKTPANIPSLDHIKAMKIDYASTAKKLETVQRYIKGWLEN